MGLNLARYRKLFEFHWGRLCYRFLRLLKAEPGSGEYVTLLESLQTMHLGRYFQYEPHPTRYDRLPSGNQSALTFAVVTPSYNQAQFLEQTILSVLHQGFPGLSYAVVDGGSVDGSDSIIERYRDRLTWSCSEKDGGQTEAIIKGFEKLEGDIMAYLNSDDVFVPGLLPYVSNYFQENPEVDVLYGHRIILDENGDEVGRWVLPPHDPESNRYFDYIPQESLFWRRSIYQKVGGLNPAFHFAMDWDLILRFQRAGARFVRLPYFLGCFRAHRKQKSQAGKGLSEVLHIIREHGGDPEFGSSFQRHHNRFVGKALLCSALLKFGIRI